MNVDIAERLASRRREAGLSQESLAEKLGVTRQAVSKWERSEASPDTDNLIALAKLYGISLDELLYVDKSIEDDVAFEAADKAFDNAADKAADKAVGENNDNTGGDFVSFDSKDGESVHIGWDGIHIVDPAGDNEVHIDRHGVNVREGKSNSWHSSHDDDWREFKSNFEGHRRKNPWLLFPFPFVVIIAYIIFGILSDPIKIDASSFAAQALGFTICFDSQTLANSQFSAWGLGFFGFISIPFYYLLVNSIVTRRPHVFLQSFYPIACAGFFLWCWLVLQHPHPAWVIFLTIPIYEWLAETIKRSWKQHKMRYTETGSVL